MVRGDPAGNKTNRERWSRVAVAVPWPDGLMGWTDSAEEWQVWAGLDCEAPLLSTGGTHATATLPGGF